MTERALVFTDEREISLQPVKEPDPAADEVVVEATLSAISSGTELLVYRGQAPSGIAADSSLETLDGDLSYPLQYGYAVTGTVVDAGADAGEWVGREVVAFHPHQTRFSVSTDHLVALPPEVGPRAGALFPSAETATNFLLDGAPRIGERVVVFGAGVIGLCTTRLLADYPLDSLVVVEPVAARRELARSFGADRAISPDELDALFGADGSHPPADLAYELSGQPSVLDDAIDVVGFDGRIVVGSWYGSKRSRLDLGGSFHRDRIEIRSSQVSTIDPELRGRWSKARRTRTTVDSLRRLDHEALITDTVPFERAGDAYARLDAADGDTVQVLLSY